MLYFPSFMSFGLLVYVYQSQWVQHLLYINQQLTYQQNKYLAKMNLQRTSSLRKTSPLAYFKKLQENLNVLKYEVDTFNRWENCSHILNISTQRQTDNKKFLKKMTQPKHHKAVLGFIMAKQKVETILTKKASINGLKSLVYSSVVKKTEHVPTQVSQSRNSITHQISKTQRLRSNQMRINLRRKQKMLQRQWQKVDNYRSQHCIGAGNKISSTNRENRQEKFIINKVIRNKPRTLSTFQSEYYSRNNTYQSEFLEVR